MVVGVSDIDLENNDFPIATSLSSRIPRFNSAQEMRWPSVELDHWSTG